MSSGPPAARSQETRCARDDRTTHRKAASRPAIDPLGLERHGARTNLRAPRSHLPARTHRLHQPQHLACEQELLRLGERLGCSDLVEAVGDGKRRQLPLAASLTARQRDPTVPSLAKRPPRMRAGRSRSIRRRPGACACRSRTRPSRTRRSRAPATAIAQHGHRPGQSLLPGARPRKPVVDAQIRIAVEHKEALPEQRQRSRIAPAVPSGGRAVMDVRDLDAEGACHLRSRARSPRRGSPPRSRHGGRRWRAAARAGARGRVAR